MVWKYIYIYLCLSYIDKKIQQVLKDVIDTDVWALLDKARSFWAPNSDQKKSRGGQIALPEEVADKEQELLEKEKLLMEKEQHIKR